MKRQEQLRKELRVQQLDAEWRRHNTDGKYDAAIGVIEQLIALQPNHEDWHAVHGYLLDQVDRLDEALEAYQKANRINPENTENHLSIALVLQQLERYQDALKYIESAIKLQPKHAPLYLNKAKCLRMLGESKLALVAVDRAIQLEPNNPENYSEKSTICLELNDSHTALNACNTALEQAQKLEQGKLAHTYTNRGTARLRLIDIASIERHKQAEKSEIAVLLMTSNNDLTDFKQMNEALADFEQALKLRPHNPAALAMRAQCLMGAKKYDEALTAIDGALRIYPRNPTMNGLRGSILLHQGHYEQALLQLNLAYEQLHLNTALLHCDRAQALFLLNRLEKAHEAINQAIALERNDEDVRRVQEKILRARGMHQTAEEVRILIETLSNNEHYLVTVTPNTANLPPKGTSTDTLADLDETLRVSRKIKGDDESYKEWFNRGLMNAQRQPKEALVAFERSIALNPNYGNAHFNRAVLLHRANQFPEALTAYQEAARCNPNHAAAHLAHGNMLMRSKRYDDAITAFTRFLDLEPENAEGYLRRARAQFESGNYTEARADCEAALERVENNQKLKETCEKLSAEISEACSNSYCP